VFKSFFLAGFEGAVGYNVRGEWFDGVALSGHDRRLHEDYAMLVAHDIHAVRECVRWPVVDTGRGFDFSTLDSLISAGRRAGLTTIYDLFHFGYPMDLDILSGEFTKRFCEYCSQVARRVRQGTEGPCYFTPVNEPSYFAWAAGEMALFPPYLSGRGDDVKIAIVRAAIEGTNAIWDACPGARIVSVDPFCRVAPNTQEDDAITRAEDFNSRIVFQSWDMLSGKLLPELGGSPRHLDVVGINYYGRNQWVLDRPEIPLADDDRRRLSLGEIVNLVWNRYGREIILSETSHTGHLRPQWMETIVKEAVGILARGIPFKGVCWYPVLEMAEWHQPEAWIPMGLWDLQREDGSLRRIGYEPVLRALQAGQAELEPQFAGGAVA
jgi:hypothetical protein